MSLKTIDKTTLNNFRKQLKTIQKQVGKDRDALRNYIDEAESLIDCCDRAYDDLESAADALSELV
jgi:ABC-type transporter Mla subunit MlaD